MSWPMYIEYGCYLAELLSFELLRPRSHLQTDTAEPSAIGSEDPRTLPGSAFAHFAVFDRLPLPASPPAPVCVGGVSEGQYYWF